MPQAVSGAQRWASVLNGAALTGFIAGPLLAHFHIVPAMVGFVLFNLGALLGIATLIAALAALLRGADARVGLATGGLITLAFLALAVSARNFPRINDITTDTASAPQFVRAATLDGNLGRDLTYPGPSFAEQQRAGYPELQPLRMEMPADEAFRRVQAAARQMRGWKITRDDPAAHALEGIATSRLFRFHDDFVVEVRPQGNGSVVQMRSKSRDGKGDIGANAARIKAFFAALTTAR